jgi:hypothetical protein
MHLLQSALLAPALCALTLLLAGVAWAVFPTEAILHWTREGGPIENLTVALYLLAAAALAAASAKLPRRLGLVLAATMLAFAARESHWHQDFTGTSMLRVSYYLGPAPLAHKLAALAVLLPVLGGLGWLARGVARRVRQGGMGLGAVNIAAWTFLLVMVLSKVADRSVALLVEDFGLAGAAGWRALQVAIEEPLEMMLPVVVLVALLQYLASRLQLARDALVLAVDPDSTVAG